MRAGGGKQKGNAYEREQCKSISLWITDGSRDDIVWRSASSGAVATVHKGKKYESQAGDIAAIDPLGIPLMSKVVIECKHYKDLQAENLIFGGKGTLVDFWNKHVILAEAKNKTPILVARQNRKPDIILMPSYFASEFAGVDHVTTSRLECVIFLLDDFLATVSYNRFINCRLL